MEGISTNRYCTQAAECVKQAGYDFIARYYSKTTQQPEKRMRLAEAQAIANAGLRLAVVYQDSANTSGYFSGERGVKDGHHAYNYAVQEIRQPAGSAIYFAVDYDATLSQIQNSVSDYFRSVKQGMENAGGGQPIYDIGVYGSGATCRLIRANLPFVKYSWLALATGWRESATYTAWNIKQIKVNENFCGLPSGDWQRVEVNGDFGQFALETAR